MKNIAETHHLTSVEVARILGVEPTTIRTWRMRGQGPRFHQPAGIGTQATYDPKDVLEFIATRKKTNRGGRRG